MRVRGSDAQQPGSRRRRWPRILGIFAALLVVGAIVATYFLQPARLTALILARASSALHLDLHTTGPGSYALRPEPRLVLPGLSASVPGAAAPFFHSGQVELALPWATLRGRSTEISSIVLKSPDLDMAAMQTWLQTQPPSAAPFKFPSLTRGLHVDDGTLRGTGWRIEHLDVELPSLADGKPMALDVDGNLLRGANASKFAFTMAATPAGVGQGLRIDDARIALKADGELPSLTATGSLLSADTFALDLAGTLQRIPRQWSASIDSAYTRPGDTPFTIGIAHTAPTAAGIVAGEKQTLRLRLALGDAKRQPTIALSGTASSGVDLEAALHGQLSRWPDAWPGLPATSASNAAPIVFDANYRGSFFLSAPITFDVKLGDTALQGQFRIADVSAWIKRKFDGLLPPIEATLSAPQIEIGGMQLHGVRMEIRGDAATPSPAATPAAVTPKS